MGLLERMWETVAEKGIGGLLKPWQTRRVGLAEAEVRAQERVLLAAAELEVTRMREASGLLLTAGPGAAGDSERRPEIAAGSSDLSSEADFPRRLAQKMAAEELRREINVTRALLTAGEVLEADPEKPPPQRAGADWLYRWRDAASEVSEPELQHLWGRVLAGEVKTPGSFSLRTLEFIRNVSSAEAQEINKLLQFAIANFVYLGAKGILEAEGINYEFLLRMKELGIVTDQDGLKLEMGNMSPDPNRFLGALTSQGRVVLVRHSDPAKKLSLVVAKLTPTASELLRISSCEAQLEYLNRMARDVTRMGFEVTMADFEDLGDKGIRFRNERPIPPEAGA
jgi:hypothetical protein